MTIALGIGIYLIATTVLISKDGVFYIEQAQKISDDPIGVIERIPIGYPFLISIAYKFVTLFSNGSSVFTWIYSAQSVTLLCRLLALIPLYFMGKLLVGSRNSFWAILILIILPYPAKICGDVVREWPHILFLATSFLFLLWGAKSGRWGMFGIAGLAAGFGCLIRHESVQSVVYGVLWLLAGLLLPKPNMNRRKLVYSLLILLIGFSLPVVPYAKARGRVLTPELQELIWLVSSSSQLRFEKAQEEIVESWDHVNTATSVPAYIANAFGKLAERVGEHLMYFFMPVLLVGIYSRFHKGSAATNIERFFMATFVILNIIMLFLLYWARQYMSRRHCLTLIVFLVFYIPVGLQTLANGLEHKLWKSRFATSRDSQLWFFILLGVGAVICLPKLFRPLRIGKQGYKDAAAWLKDNTSPTDSIAAPDNRICFYAERKGTVYEKEVPKQAKYVVQLAKGEDGEVDLGGLVKQDFSVMVGKRSRKQKLLIYRVLQ
jgi:hypothetical protein